jgi:hypothetical protein
VSVRLLSEDQLAIVRYCADEVERQGDHPNVVGGYVAAWTFAQERYRHRAKMSHSIIQHCAWMISPRNSLAYRDDDVVVARLVPDADAMTLEILYGIGSEMVACTRCGSKVALRKKRHEVVKRFPPPEAVPELMEGFLDQFDSMAPEEAYFAYLEIHPFGDGNGRIGKILLNWRAKTLDDPIMPSNPWGISNP